jgi:hypothetical protein
MPGPYRQSHPCAPRHVYKVSNGSECRLHARRRSHTGINRIRRHGRPVPIIKLATAMVRWFYFIYSIIATARVGQTSMVASLMFHVYSLSLFFFFAIKVPRLQYSNARRSSLELCVKVSKTGARLMNDRPPVSFF